ncbi:MAG TPA: pilus assembly protein TadG-related protein [Anaerolineales bacterium]|nr:pilus assembly protein TadG-related protein [Anaerolineales bacterium]
MLHKKSEKGQALVLIALAAIGLFGFTALSIDGGMVFSDRRHAQNAADTAVLAAALARVRSVSDPDGAAITAGIARASSNGYDTDANSTVEVNICDEPGIVCEGMPAGANPSDYVRVKITSIVNMMFARIVGRTSVTNVVTAVAKAEVGGPSPVFDGAALVALSQTDPDAIGVGGNTTLDINNSGIFSNSSNTCSMGGNGNGTVSVDTAYDLVGGYCQSGGSLTLNGGPIQNAQQIEYPPDLDIPPPSITCSGTGQITPDATPNHYTIHPGNFSSLDLTNGTYTFVGNGKFCFNGDVKFTSADVIANHVDILITAGSFQTAGNSTFNCDYMLVYINGGSGMHFNGNSSNTCTNVTFYAETGSVTWNGNVANTFTAPTSGVHQEYSNLLIYMPHGNTSPLHINGNVGNTLTGSIIAISSAVTIEGNSGTTGLNSNITGYTIELVGNSNTTINYRPEDQFTVVDPSDIALTK